MNVNHSKIVPIAISVAVGLFAISMLLRFVLFSQYGIPSSYLLFALPGAGFGLVLLLLRLGVFTGGQRTSSVVAPWQQHLGAQPPTASQHLQELDHLLRAGAISQAEYTARRQQIIQTI